MYVPRTTRTGCSHGSGTRGRRKNRVIKRERTRRGSSACKGRRDEARRRETFVVILAGVGGDLCWLMKKLCPDLAIADNGRVSLINDAAGCALRRFLSSVYTECEYKRWTTKLFEQHGDCIFIKLRMCVCVCVFLKMNITLLVSRSDCFLD